jgi:hypothetical protein
LRRVGRRRGAGIVACAVGRVRLRLNAGRNGLQGAKILLDRRPRSGIILCGKRKAEVGVIGENVGLDARGNGIRGVQRQAMEQSGIGRVGQGVAAGLDRAAGVEIPIG